MAWFGVGCTLVSEVRRLVLGLRYSRLTDVTRSDNPTQLTVTPHCRCTSKEPRLAVTAQVQFVIKTILNVIKRDSL